MVNDRPFLKLRGSRTERNSDTCVERNIIPNKRSGAAKSHFRYVQKLFSTPNSTQCKYYREIVRVKVYFNARFDDVMLIVKGEMASVLRGPLQPPYYNFTMCVFSTLWDRRISTGRTCHGKLGNGMNNVVIGDAVRLILVNCGRTCSHRQVATTS